MRVEAFLRFWSHYNTLIIEILIGLILLTVVYLAFRTFFGADEEVASGPGAELKSADLEKTLQKILERQDAGAAAAVSPEASSAASPAPEAEGLAASGGELAELQTRLVEKERQIEELRQATVPVAPGGLSDDEKKTYEDRLKDLEARLAEYEIISEDIADLSFYKEENAKLQGEIESLKAGPVSAPAPAAPAADFPLPPETAPAETEPATADVPASPVPEAAAPEQAAAAPEPSSEATPLPKEEEAEIMNQFENFVKKG